MTQFKEFYEAREFVDMVGAFCLSEEIEDDLGKGLGDIARGVGKGLAGLPLAPLKGMWHAGRRLLGGSDSVERHDAEQAFRNSKIDLLKWLMSMTPEVRKQEIGKLKNALDEIGGINNYDPQARDSWLSRAAQSGVNRNYSKPNYGKLAG